MSSICDQLDRYLDGVLDGTDRPSFESHLETCEQCQNEIEVNAKLEDAFVEAWQSIKTPKHLHAIVQPGSTNANSNIFVGPQKIQTASKSIAFCLAIAAMILLAFSLRFAFLNGSPNNVLTKAHPKNSIAPTTQPITTIPIATATPNANSNLIFVPQETQSTNFTILRAYPTINVNRSSELLSTGE